MVFSTNNVFMNYNVIRGYVLTHVWCHRVYVHSHNKFEVMSTSSKFKNHERERCRRTGSVLQQRHQVLVRDPGDCRRDARRLRTHLPNGHTGLEAVFEVTVPRQIAPRQALVAGLRIRDRKDNETPARARLREGRLGGAKSGVLGAGQGVHRAPALQQNRRNVPGGLAGLRTRTQHVRRHMVPVGFGTFNRCGPGAFSAIVWVRW